MYAWYGTAITSEVSVDSFYKEASGYMLWTSLFEHVCEELSNDVMHDVNAW